MEDINVINHINDNVNVFMKSQIMLCYSLIGNDTGMYA